MKRVAVIQSSYIPWKGYFDIIHDVDLFIFFDDVQFTSRDWRTRNRIKTTNGPIWLTIPVGSDRNRLICDVPLQDPKWPAMHWRSISHSYTRAPFFRHYRDFFEQIYLGSSWESLSQLNQSMTSRIASELLGIRTVFQDSRQFAAEGSKLARMLDLLKKAGADSYVSGPSAKDYIDPQAFEAAGIELIFKSYAGYPEYPQVHPPFNHAVSIIDLLFNTGPDAPYYIWGWRAEQK